MQYLWSCITGVTKSLSCCRNVPCRILVLLVIVHPNDTPLKTTTTSICSALQISLRYFQQALLGFIFCALAATNIAAGFSVWHLSLILITIFIDTQIWVFLHLNFNHTHFIISEDCLALIWVCFSLGFCFNDASTKITEFQKNQHPFQPIQKNTLEPNRINLHLEGWFDG